VAAYLEVVEGRSRGRRYALEGAESVIGRDEACEVSLLDESASRRHAVVLRRGDRFLVKDLGSRNGTRVQGEKTQGEKLLRSGDEVALGTTRLRFVDEQERLKDTRPLPEDPAGEGDAPFTIEGALGIDGAPRVAAPSAAEGRLRALLALGRLIAVADGPEALLAAALAIVRPALGADRALVVLTGPGGALETAGAIQDPPGPLPSTALLEKARLGREALLVSADEPGSRALLLGRESAVRQGIRAVLAAPILASGAVLGVLYADRHRSGGRFAEQDLETLAEVARQLGAALTALSRTRDAREESEAWRSLALRPARSLGGGPGGGALGGSGAPLGAAPAFLAAIETATRAARADVAVLLTGETGTGKEVFARLVHERSARATGPFVPVNCAAVPEALLESELFGHERGAFTGADRRRRGLFELAKGGTVFLDEVGEMPATLQAKLLRVLETREVRRVGSEETLKVDFRLVAATNVDLERAVRERNFREDLFFRLNVLAVRLPPLRERPGDAELMAERFIEDIARAAGRRGLLLSEAARAAIRAARWPGNVRELRNAVERAVVLATGPEVGPEAFLAGAGGIAAARPAGSTETALEAPISIAEAERRAIVIALRHTGGKKGKAAEVLGIAHPTLNRKLKEFGLNDSFGDD